jgi:hypothetical protein
MVTVVVSVIVAVLWMKIGKGCGCSTFCNKMARRELLAALQEFSMPHTLDSTNHFVLYYSISICLITLFLVLAHLQLCHSSSLASLGLPASKQAMLPGQSASRCYRFQVAQSQRGWKKPHAQQQPAVLPRLALADLVV